MRAFNFIITTAIILSASLVSCTSESVMDDLTATTTAAEQTVYIKTADGVAPMPANTKSVEFFSDGASDLEYAVAEEAASRSNDGLSYRSAMAKVAVNLSCANTQLNIQVNSVRIANLYNEGSFNLPSRSQNASWNNLSAKGDLSLSESTFTLAAEADTFEFFAIPQSNNGISLEIDCTICDAHGTQLWPSEGTSAVMSYDLNTQLTMGHNSTMTIDLTNPDVLDAISFTGSVSDFQGE